MGHPRWNAVEETRNAVVVSRLGSVVPLVENRGKWGSLSRGAARLGLPRILSAMRFRQLSNPFGACKNPL